MARLRSYLLLTLVIGVLAAWAGAAGSSRLLDTWGLLSDTETDTGNTITADTLGAPSSLNAVDDGPTKVDLSWTASNDSYATGYKVFRCSGAACNPTTLVHTLTEADTNCAADSSCDYEDTGRTGNTTYCYALRTTYLNWTSPPSNTDCATTAIPVNLNTLKLNSPSAGVDTLVTGTATGLRTVNSKTNPPFEFITWVSSPVTVTSSAVDWTLTLDLITVSPNLEGATLVVDLTLYSGSSCGSGSATPIAAGGPTTFTADGSMTLSSQTFTAPKTGILCLKITNTSEDSGAAHDARIVTTGGSTLSGPFDP